MDKQSRKTIDPGGREPRRSLEVLTDVLADLAGGRDPDALCRAAVTRGRAALGVSRVALWFRTEDSRVVAGTYGVDERGRLRDERASRVEVSEDSLMGRVLFRHERTVIQRDGPLRDDCGAEVGRGDAVIAAISAEREVLGCVCADNLGSARRIDDFQADLLFVFGAAVGQIWRRLKAEQAASEVEVRYRRVFESALDAIVIFDPATHRIIDANEAWLRMYGRTREELPNLDILSLSADPDASKQTLIEAVTDRARSLPVRYHLRRDGSTFPVEFSASCFPMGGRDVICGVARDISDRVRAEAELRQAQDELEQRVRARTAELVGANQTLMVEIDQRRRAEQVLSTNERRFRAIFNSTFQFIGLLTTDGVVLEVNQTSLDAAGLRAEDVINRPFQEARWWAVSPEARQRLTEAIARAARGEAVRYEVDLLGKDDRVITIDFSIRPIFDERGHVALLVPEGHDITARKRTE